MKAGASYMAPSEAFPTPPELVTEPQPAFGRRAFLRLGALSAGVVAAANLVGGCGIFGGDDEPPKQEANQGNRPGMPEFDASRESNLLAKGNWEFMPGVEAGDKGNLKVSRAGLAIRKEKKTWRNENVPEYFPVAPINAWTHVKMSKEDGDIGVTARLSDVKGRATMLLQGDPTFRYDERIYVHAGVGVTVEGSKVTANVWFGNGEAPDVTKEIDLGAAASDVDVAVVQANNAIAVTANGKTITIPNARVFESGQLWFGMDASKSFGLDELKAHPLGDNTLKVVDSTKTDFGRPDPQGLQAVVSRARPDLLVGTAVDLIPLTYDEKYANLVMGNSGGLATEMLAKAQNLQPERGKFVWDDFDAFVDLAQRHGKKIHGHTLVFGEANPQWMEKAVAEGSPEDALTIMRDHIKAVVSRHKGKVATWDVINEPFDEDDWSKLRPHMWQNKIGKRYIEEAFRAAHKADPDALLGINDWALEHDPNRWDALIDLLNDLKSKDVPVHFVGFQAHLDPDDIGEILGSNILAKRFKQLEDMGIKVRISEISIDGDNPQRQAETYAKVMRTCMKAKNCLGINFWGLASNETYMTSEPNGDYKIPPEQFGDNAPWQKNPEDGSYTRKGAANALFAGARS